MEEILHHLGCKKLVNNGGNYLSTKVVQDFFYQQYFSKISRGFF